LALADASGWKRFAVVGHSMSSLVALQLTQRHPERIACTVVITPPPPAGFGVDDAALAHSRALALGDDATRLAFWQQRAGDRLSPGWIAYKVARWRATSEPEAVSAYVQMFARDGLPDRVTKIAGSVLAITGEQDAEPMRSAAVKRALSTLCADLTVIPIAESGHYPMQETPPLLVAHIERFLELAVGRVA
jgi:pimeloyl-ACP methyl ester carboxylesterase